MCAFGTDRPPRGAALIIVMLVMAVLLLAGTTFLTISSTESQIALNEGATVKAFALAEAALQKALAHLDASSSYPGEPLTNLWGGQFTVTVGAPALTELPAEKRCYIDNAKVLDVTAWVPVRSGKARVEIKAIADQISYPYRWSAFAAIPNQVVMWPYQTIFGEDRTESELWIKDNSRTDSFDSRIGQYNPTSDSSANPPPNPILDPHLPDARTGGNIGGNGDLTLANGVKIGGSVRAGDALHKPSSVVPTGGYVESLSPNSTSVGEPLPAVSPPATLAVTPSLPTQPSGTTATLASGSLSVTSGTLTLPATGSPYYFTSMTFSNSTALQTSGGPVTIYVPGTVTLGSNVTFGAHPGTQLRIILKSDGANWLDAANFAAGQNFILHGSLYGKYTNIQLQDGAQAYGSVVGRTVVLHQNSAAHFDQAMLNQEICHNGKFAIRRGSWREVIP